MRVFAEDTDLDIERFRVGFQRFFVPCLFFVHVAHVVVCPGLLQVPVAVHGNEHVLGLPVMKKRLFVVALPLVHVGHVVVCAGHVLGVLAGDLDLDIERLRVGFQRLLVLPLCFVHAAHVDDC